MLAGAHDPAIATNRPRPRPTATALLRPRPGHGTAAAAHKFSLYELIGPPPKLWGVLWLQTWPNNYASRIRSTLIEQDPFHMYGTETRSIRMERTLFHTVWNGGRSIPRFQDAAIYKGSYGPVVAFQRACMISHTGNVGTSTVLL